MVTFKTSLSVELPASLPDWIELLPSGTFSGRDGRGPWHCTPSDVIARTREYQGGVDIPVDYDHQLEHAAQNGRPAPAAGWISELEARDDGVWGRVEWTDRAREHLAAREFRYLSPVFYHETDGEVLLLESAALTNVPNLTGLKALARTDGPHFSQGEPDMDILKTLASVLGISEADTTEAAVESAVRSLAAENGSMKATLSSLGKALKSDDETSASIMKAAQSLASRAESPDPAKFVPMDTFNAVHEELGKMKAAQAVALVEQGKAEGKITPGMENWAKSYASTDPESFKAFLASAPDMRPGAQKSSHATATPPEGSGAPDVPSSAKELCRAMGVSEESYLTTRKAKEKEHGSADE